MTEELVGLGTGEERMTELLGAMGDIRIFCEVKGVFQPLR